jgi:peptide/nickel transport system ATP-binding protein
MSDEPLLSVRDLSVRFRGDAGTTLAVDGITFDLGGDEVLGIVGESGSGKSATVLSIVGLQDPSAEIDGEVAYEGRDLLDLDPGALRRLRGRALAMVFQDPMTSLNPVYRVGWQIAEQLREHLDLDADAARARAIELLAEVGLPDPEQRIDAFPHELSGGQRQRVMIALALSCHPRILIADEPTTALDVTIQAQILDLIRRLRAEQGSSVILITHDMGVIAEMTERVLVMYGGRVVEQGTTRDVFAAPLHPYTWGLLRSIPRLDEPRPDRLEAIPPPSPGWRAPPGGCVFAARCAHRFDACDVHPPLINRIGDGSHLDACHLPLDRRPWLGPPAAPGDGDPETAGDS